ncbi:HNH endonuclease signature motif containing protein [Agromyces albus]|uniref:HNH endonuclease n=1 Tax=Agromyces albus TaxID=205332 RepID=A0A4Q2KY23_9MICO|nr:HNH endonuclease signature motif containing protein [Agromyces albus]RXZ68782.1 HNH endonuclease [Agromyces albus]
MPEAPAALRELEVACGDVLDAWAGALLRPSQDPEADVSAMGDDGLVRATEALARLGRRVEALQARCAAGVAERSRGGIEGPDLARQHGFGSAERLIAQATGGRHSDAARLVAVGEATARRASFSGASLPPRHPHIAGSLESGVLCVGAADLIRRFLDRITPGVARDALDAAEQLLVDRAPIVGIDGLGRLIKQLEAHLDPDGVKPREDELRARRSLAIWEDAAGMINLRGAFDPANGAPIKLAIEALVGAELHRARDAKRPFDTDTADGAQAGDDRVPAEDRTIAQLNADALADIARLSLSSADAPPALRTAVVITRIDLDALESGHGHATIDGIDQPVSASTAREIAASAGVTPMILSGTGEVLDLGRTARLFSPAQKIALVERDGGCAWPGCHRPPSHTQAHHIAWWKRDSGPTDLANGIMLCSHHHHRVHDDGWRIVIRDRRSWFIPPPHLDPEQRPRPGNVAARHLLAHRAA